MANLDLTPEQVAKLAKPIKGQAWLDKKQRRAEHEAAEDKIMRAAKVRDGNKCRFPNCEHMPKKPRIECAHVVQHRGIGGNPALDRTVQHKLMALCFIHHGLFDRQRSIEIEPLTERGTDGPCAFYQKNNETGAMEHVATETTIGISEIRRS